MGLESKRGPTKLANPFAIVKMRTPTAGRLRKQTQVRFFSMGLRTLPRHVLTYSLTH